MISASDCLHWEPNVKTRKLSSTHSFEENFFICAAGYNRKKNLFILGAIEVVQIVDSRNASTWSIQNCSGYNLKLL